MKKVILLSLAVAVMAACQSPQQKAEKRAQSILKQLTLEEKASLMVYNSPAVERLGIRSYNWWDEDAQTSSVKMKPGAPAPGCQEGIVPMFLAKILTYLAVQLTGSSASQT